MDRGQSEAIASAVHDAVRGSVATKQDFDLAVEKLRSDVSVVKWMCATLVASALGMIVKAFL